MENEENKPQEKRKSNHFKVVVSIIILVSVFSLGYFISNFDNPYQTKQSCNEQINQTAMNAVNYGYETALVSILTEAVKCDQVPINYQNETYNIFLVECLNTQPNKEINQ